MDYPALRKKRVLVTGGKGFLGSYLVEALQNEDANVFIIDKVGTSGNNEFSADITDHSALTAINREIRPQLVFHLASSLNRKRDFCVHDEVMRINYKGTLNLLKSLQPEPPERFIFVSTSEVYGDIPAPFREDMLPVPVSPYSLSKYFSELAIRTYSDIYGTNYTIMRLFNFFGKKMPGDLFIPQLMNALISGDDFNMTGGEQKRDFLFAGDVVRALMLAAVKEEARNEMFNVCSGTGTKLKHLVLKFRERINSKSKINLGAIPYRNNEVWNMTGSNRKITNKLGFHAQYSIDQAINKLIEVW